MYQKKKILMLFYKMGLKLVQQTLKDTLLAIDSLNLFSASDSPPLKGVFSSCIRNLW